MPYQMVDEDKDTFTIQHPDGTQFNVAKDLLSPQMHDQIRSSKNYSQAPTPAFPGSDISLPDTSNMPDTTGPTPLPKTPTEAGQEAYLNAKSQMEGPISRRQLIEGTYRTGQGYEPWAYQTKATEGEKDEAAVNEGLKAKQMAQNKIDYQKFQEQQNYQSAIAQNQRREQLGLNPLPLPQDPSKLLASMGNTPPRVPGDLGIGEDQQTMNQQQARAQESGLFAPFAMQEKGIKQAAEAQGQLAQAQASAYDQYNQNFQNYTQTRDKELGNIMQENADLTQKVMNGKVDPEQYWNNRSGAAKARSIIGIILGGIGSGLTGGSNMSLQLLQKHIDNDIEAQKLDLAKNQNLLSQNLQKYRDVGTAEAQTRMDMLSALQGELGKQTAKYNDPLSKAQALQLNAQVEQQKQQYALQLAEMRAQAQGLVGGVPVGQESLFQLTNPKYTQNRVVVQDPGQNPVAYTAVGTPEETSKVRTFEQLTGPTLSAIDQLDKLGPDALINPKTKAQATALMYRLGQLVPQLSNVEIGGKRPSSPEAQAEAQEALSDPKKWKDLLEGGIKNKQFVKDLQDSKEAIRSQYLPGYRGPQHFATFRKE